MKIYTDASTRNNLSGVAFVITDEKIYFETYFIVNIEK